MATPTTPSSQQIFGVRATDTTEELLRQINNKLSGLNQLSEVIASLQGVISSLGNSSISLVGIQTTSQQSDNKLTQILDSINLQISSLSAASVILATLKSQLDVLHQDNIDTGVKIDLLHSDNLVVEGKIDTLHSDNLVVEGKIDTLHTDNLAVEGKIDTLHADNLVVEQKIDGVRSDTQEFKASFDSVKQKSGGREVVLVQQEEIGVLQAILSALNRVELQLSIITEEETV